MEKVYVIYEIREETFEKLNDLGQKYDIIKVFKNENNALTYLNNEISFQCNEEDWTYQKGESNNQLYVNFYYWNEWQYSLFLKEMVVE